MRAKAARLFLAAMFSLTLTSLAVADDRPAASPDPYALLHAVIDVLKRYHINRGTVDWAAIEARALAIVPNAKSSADTMPGIQFVIASLHEHHTFMISPERWRDLMTGHSSNAAYNAAVFSLPVVKTLPGGIGYIALPGHAGSAADDRAYVGAARDALRRFHASGICRFIVDLRKNVGGSGFPMMGAVKSLLGAQPYGYWDDGGGGAPEAWTDPDEITHADKTPGGDYAPVPPDDSRHPVAVLLDRHTISAGEMTAIAFEGRPRTMFFGEPSGGYTSGNETASLPGGWHIAVTTVRAQDRHHRPFRVAVVPDVETPPGDETQAVALAWLRKQRCTR